VGIEGLRAIAAGSVLVFHSWAFSAPRGKAVDAGPLNHVLPDLAFGVTLFFTLSGFLLYRPFAAAVLRGQPLPSIGKYLRNRALRILPAYWVILLISAVVLGSVLVPTGTGELENGALRDPDLIARSAFFLQYVHADTVLIGIGPAWSLAVEVVFYLALPGLALTALVLGRTCASRGGRRLAVLAPPALMLVVGLSGKAAAANVFPGVGAYAGWRSDWHSVLERSIWTHADLFAFGMAVAVLRVDSEDHLLRLPRHWAKGAVLVGLLAYGLTAHYTLTSEQLSYSPWNTVMALACAMLLSLVVLPATRFQKSRLVRVLEWRPLVAAGVVSYSVFLWHEPLVRWLSAHGLTLAGRTGFVVNTIVLATLTGALAFLTYRYVEAPALRWKRRTVANREVDTDLRDSQLQAAP
jgi:peptidoglycan/LPS O-acetylase OafA/YrhL